MSNIRRMFKHLLPSTFFLFEDMSNVNSDLSIDSLLCITDLCIQTHIVESTLISCIVFVCFHDILRGSLFDIVNLPQGPQRWYFYYLLFEKFENLERAGVSLLMLSAKQGSLLYLFNVWYDAASTRD